MAVVSFTEGEVVGLVEELEVSGLVDEAGVLLLLLLLVGALEVGAGVSGDAGVLVDFTGEVDDDIEEVVVAAAGGAVVVVEVDMGDVVVVVEDVVVDEVVIEEVVVVDGVDVSEHLVLVEDDELEAVNVNEGPDSGLSSGLSGEGGGAAKS